MTNMEKERRELGFTQLQLREKTNTSLNTIVALEKGQIDNVRVKTLKKIAVALNSTVQKIFFNEE